MSGFKSQLAMALAMNVALKVLTFSLSTYLTRQLLPEQSGVSFTYVVYVDVVLFIAREAVRNVASRYNLTEDSHAVEHDKQHSNTAAGAFSGSSVRFMVNFAAFTIPLAFLTILALECQHLVGLRLLPSLLRVTSASVNDSSFMSLMMERPAEAWLQVLPEVTVWCSVLMMACAEPCLVLAQSLDLFRTVVLAEFYALVARLSLVICAVRTCGMQTNWEVRMVNAFGQLAYAVVFLLYYSLLCSGKRRVVLARAVGGSESLLQAREAAHHCVPPRWRHPSVFFLQVPFPWCVLSVQGTLQACRRWATLFRSFFFESLLRVLVLDAEGFALTSFGTEAARGYYQLVTNLGSMVARLIFRVWENACFVKWSRDIAAGRSSQATALLLLMLRTALYAGLGMSLIGPLIAPLLLRTLYSTRWATPEAVDALQWYCFLLPCLALGGLFDAFLRALASASTMARIRKWMLMQSFLYASACFTLMWADGAEGDGYIVSKLIAVSIANALARIGSAVYLILSDPDTRRAKQLLTLQQLLLVFRLRVVVPVGVLFVATRVLLPSSVAVVGLAGVAYVVVVLCGDPEVRDVVLRTGGTVMRRRSLDASRAAAVKED